MPTEVETKLIKLLCGIAVVGTMLASIHTWGGGNVLPAKFCEQGSLVN